jgi:hypothetical protein
MADPAVVTLCGCTRQRRRTLVADERTSPLRLLLTDGAPVRGNAKITLCSYDVTVRANSLVDIVALGSLGIWQLWWLRLVAKKVLRVGAGLLLYFGLSVAGLVWAGISPIAAVAVLVVVSIAMTAAVATQGPADFRVRAGALGLLGGGLLVGGWAANGMAHWRAVVVVTALTTVTVLGVMRLLDLAAPRPAELAAGSGPMFKYTYWSQRAIAALADDNISPPKSRFQFTLDQIVTG